jgi:hypothetical protein
MKLNMQKHGTPKLIPPTCFESMISRIIEEIQVVQLQDSGWIIQAIFLGDPDISRIVFSFLEMKRVHILGIRRTSAGIYRIRARNVARYKSARLEP